MQIPDLINGIFEAGGGLFLLLDVRQMYRDKKLSGVHWVPKIWFMTWGYWNVFYYPHLNQTLSFYGGLGIVSVNTLWLCMYLYYARGNKNVASPEPLVNGTPNKSGGNVTS